MLKRVNRPSASKHTGQDYSFVHPGGGGPGIGPSFNDRSRHPSSEPLNNRKDTQGSTRREEITGNLNARKRRNFTLQSIIPVAREERTEKLVEGSLNALPSA